MKSGNYCLVVLYASISLRLLPPRIEKIRKMVSVGDILISVNERIVLDDTFNSVAALLELLM